jgi:hypothetical protein
VVTWPVVIDLAVPSRSGLCRARPIRLRRASGGRVYRARTPMAPAVSLPRRTTRSALQKQTAAGLLPEASDSWAVEAE